MPRFGRILLVLVLTAALAGCSTRRPITVKGKVLNKGAPLAVARAGVQVTLVPVDPQTSSSNRVGRAEPDGSFTIEDVPPGKYRVAVEQFDPTPMVDKLGGAFSPAKTKIVREVDGKAPLDIDLSKPDSQ